MGFAPIIRNVYIDPNEVKQESIPSSYLWEILLYNRIGKGEKPVYRIICADKNKLIDREAEIKEKYDVVSAMGPTCRNKCKEYIVCFDEPIVLDIVTGEVII